MLSLYFHAVFRVCARHNSRRGVIAPHPRRLPALDPRIRVNARHFANPNIVIQRRAREVILHG
jgi:hypothetical protein